MPPFPLQGPWDVEEGTGAPAPPAHHSEGSVGEGNPGIGSEIQLEKQAETWRGDQPGLGPHIPEMGPWTQVTCGLGQPVVGRGSVQGKVLQM